MAFLKNTLLDYKNCQIQNLNIHKFLFYEVKNLKTSQKQDQTVVYALLYFVCRSSYVSLQIDSTAEKYERAVAGNPSKKGSGLNVILHL